MCRHLGCVLERQPNASLPAGSDAGSPAVDGIKEDSVEGEEAGREVGVGVSF